MVCGVLCILYGIQVDEWHLPYIENGDDFKASFQMCSFALSLILSFRIKMVREWLPRFG